MKHTGTVPHGWMLGLVAVTAMEIAVFRLAEPVLAPGIGAPSTALAVLTHAVSYLGRFLFYFTTTWAVVVLVARLIALAQHSAKKNAAPLLVGLFLGALTLFSLVQPPSAGVTIVLEGSFVLLAFLLTVLAATSSGAAVLRVGLLVLLVPFVIHFYGQVSLQWFAGEEMLWNGTLDELQQFGRSSVLFAAVSSPYFFAPRPFRTHFRHLGPWLATLFAGGLASWILTRNYTLAAELASQALGIELLPGASHGLVVVYILAICAVTWTLAACAIARSRHYRSVGVGLALIVAAGYGYDWPMQFPLVLCGLCAITAAARDLLADGSAPRVVAA